MKKLLGASVMALAMATSAHAGKPAPAAPAAAPSQWPQAGDFMVRGRMINVMPDEDSTVSSIGGKVDVSNTLVPEVDFSYFFTKNIAAELILATSKHHITSEGSTLDGLDVGSAWVLPPTLTLQYHYTDFNSFKPYVGAGVNYTMYYAVDKGAAAVTELKMKDSFGWALQAGVDVPISGNWGWNFDVKKLFVNADAKINTTIDADIELDPWIVGTGITYRF